MLAISVMAFWGTLPSWDTPSPLAIPKQIAKNLIKQFNPWTMCTVYIYILYILYIYLHKCIYTCICNCTPKYILYTYTRIHQFLLILPTQYLPQKRNVPYQNRALMDASFLPPSSPLQGPWRPLSVSSPRTCGLPLRSGSWSKPDAPGAGLCGRLFSQKGKQNIFKI